MIQKIKGALNAHAYHIYVFNDVFEESEMFTKYKVKLDKDGRGTYKRLY